MLFQDSSIAPAARPVKFGDEHAAILSPQLIDTILKTIHLKQSPVTLKSLAVDGTEHRFGPKPFIGGYRGIGVWHGIQGETISGGAGFIRRASTISTAPTAMNPPKTLQTW